MGFPGDTLVVERDGVSGINPDSRLGHLKGGREGGGRVGGRTGGGGLERCRCSGGRPHGSMSAVERGEKGSERGMARGQIEVGEEGGKEAGFKGEKERGREGNANVPCH